jgi:XRE family transcriptional regulator, regulator of sulfur utilization
VLGVQESQETVKEPNTYMKVLRKGRGMTQEEVAEKAEITQQHYSLIERGEISPTMRTARKIARALGVDLDAVWPEV